jgi:hypothetical protein
MEIELKQICPPEGGRYKDNFETNDKGCRAEGPRHGGQAGATFKPKARANSRSLVGQKTASVGMTA